MASCLCHSPEPVVRPGALVDGCLPILRARCSVVRATFPRVPMAVIGPLVPRAKMTCGLRLGPRARMAGGCLSQSRHPRGLAVDGPDQGFPMPGCLRPTPEMPDGAGLLAGWPRQLRPEQ